MDGSSLEFLFVEYPGYFKTLRDLVESGRIDLISSLYTPSLWVAFAKRDLIKNVQLNQACLHRLGLPWNRTFFAQEGLFGSGVEILDEHFDYAICREDYLEYWYPGLLGDGRLFRVGNLNVVVASNHILNDLNDWMPNAPARIRRQITLVMEAHIREGITANPSSRFAGRQGSFDAVDWLWYHCGDGNHFGSIYKPDDLERCYYDPTWSNIIESRLACYEVEGYRIGSVAELASVLDYRTARALPPLIEAGLNPERSDGVFCWMGRQTNAWENDSGILSAVSRLRARIIMLESRILPDLAIPGPSKIREQFAEVWSTLLFSQISDFLGWAPSPQAVNAAFQLVERGLNLSNKLRQLVDLSCERSCMGHQQVVSLAQRNWEDLLGPSLLGGGVGISGFCAGGPTGVMFEARVRVEIAGPCGVSFRLRCKDLVFCPSGLEDRPSSVALRKLGPKRFYLPLSNGLLRLAEDLYLIRDNRYAYVAAHIDVGESTVSFMVSGSGVGRSYHWRFHVFVGSLEAAVETANVINLV
jgi:hypothetical protein